MPSAAHRWAIAFSGALLIHAALVAAVVWKPATSEDEPVEAPPTALSLAAFAPASSDVAEASTEVPEARVSDSPPPTARPITPETVRSADMIRQAPPEPVDAVEIVDMVDHAQAVLPSPVQAVETVQAAPPDTRETVKPAVVAVAETVPPDAPDIVEATMQQPVEQSTPEIPDAVRSVAPAPPPQRPAEAPALAEPAPVQTVPPLEPQQVADAVIVPGATPRKVAETTPVAALAPASAKPVEAPIAEAPVPAPPRAVQPVESGPAPEDVTESTVKRAVVQSVDRSGQAASEYGAKLEEWFSNNFTEYPRRARERRLEGTVLIYFRIDENGNILEMGIEKSSGHNVLDEGVLRMLKDTRALLQPPRNVDRVTVPFRFTLR